jgi:hypothetical protein
VKPTALQAVIRHLETRSSESNPNRSHKKTRGGLRIIYYYFQEATHIWLLTVYDKDEADDLTAKQKKAYQQFVREIRNAWAAKKRARI